ncbi:hypothetical protein PAMA_001028 [Pampus argenteus]
MGIIILWFGCIPCSHTHNMIYTFKADSPGVPEERGGAERRGEEGRGGEACSNTTISPGFQVEEEVGEGGIGSRGSPRAKASYDSSVTMETASHHKLSVTTETGPGRARTALVTTAQRPEPAELAVRAHRRAASPRRDRWRRRRERDERKEERTGGGGEEREMRGKRRGQVEEEKREG